MDYLGKVQQSLENVIVSMTPLAPLAVPTRTTCEEVGGYQKEVEAMGRGGTSLSSLWLT